MTAIKQSITATRFFDEKFAIVMPFDTILNGDIAVRFPDGKKAPETDLE